MILKLKNIFKNTVKPRVLIGLSIGFVGGYLYGIYFRCDGNSCPITSKPINSALYFGILGIFLTYKENKNEQNSNN